MRIVLNFAHRCNMHCEWCYVPFMPEAPSADTCMRIVQRIAQVGFKVITFGGGDPLLYPFLPQLLEVAHEAGLFVHVDTNGIGLHCNRATMSLLCDCVGLLGLPLDGPRPDIHNAMRSARSHFELVVSKLAWLAPFIHKVKINTFVSSSNSETITQMVPLIKAFGPARWSVYQYWPLSGGKSATAEHFISTYQFRKATERLPAVIDKTRVETNPTSLRRLTYPFVSHAGEVYLHHPSDQTKYELLGPIFDDSVIVELFAKCTGERANALSRYV